MITHSSKITESGYEQPRAIRLPLILSNPRRQINKHEEITDEHLAELGLLPAEEPTTLAEGQKYDTPQLVDGVVSVAAIDKTQDDIDAELDNIQTNTIASRFQLKRALHELGQLDAAKNEYNNIVDPLLILEWQDNNTIRRNGPLALDMQTRFSKTDQKMDDLFALAQTY